MGAPVLVGAGVGALASLATGRDPLQGAALGGLTGGAFGGAEGFGSGFTEGGLFNLGSSITPAASVEPAIGSAVTPEFTPSLLTNSANPMAGPMTATVPDAYTGYSSMMSNPNIGAAQSFGMDGTSAMATGGGYSQAAPTDLIAPDWTPTLGGEASVGGGYEPSTSLLDTAYQSVADMSPIEQIGLANTTIDALSPEEQQAIEAQANRISPPKKVVPERGTMVATNVPSRTFRPRFV